MTGNLKGIAPLHGIYFILGVLPIWAVAFTMYIVTFGALFVLRDKFEGLYYQTSYSAQLGDGSLICVALLGAGIVQRGQFSLPHPLVLWEGHAGAILIALTLGVVWYRLDLPTEWGDSYHHLVIAPLFCYLGFTLLPVILFNGTRVEKVSTMLLVMMWAGLVAYDIITKRINQRHYYSLGEYVDKIKSHKSRGIMADTGQAREKLLTELNERIKFDNRRAWWHLRLAVFWTWVAIVGSVGTSLLVAFVSLPRWLISVLAAFPAIVIAVGQRFSFYGRSRWHCMMETQLRKLVRALIYEDASPSDISVRYSELMIDMELKYPGKGLDLFVGSTEKYHVPKPIQRRTVKNNKQRVE